MSDEQNREKERSAIVGGPDEEETAALSNCRIGNHVWSSGFRPIGTFQSGAVISRRVCFWCFAYEHKRHDEKACGCPGCAKPIDGR